MQQMVFCQFAIEVMVLMLMLRSSFVMEVMVLLAQYPCNGVVPISFRKSGSAWRSSSGRGWALGQTWHYI